jgi:hypothetical protein
MKQITHTAFEQDVKVSVIEERDVRVEEGDEVDILVRGRIKRTIDGEPGEVEIVDTVPVKIIAVRRRQRG